MSSEMFMFNYLRGLVSYHTVLFSSVILWLSACKRMNTISLKNQSAQWRLVNVGVKYLDIPVAQVNRQGLNWYLYVLLWALSFLPNVVQAVVVQCINTDLVKVEYHMCTVIKRVLRWTFFMSKIQHPCEPNCVFVVLGPLSSLNWRSGSVRRRA